MIPAGETGKTEAWVVLETGQEGRIYAGLKPSTTADSLRGAIAGRDSGEAFWRASRQGPAMASWWRRAPFIR